MSTAGHPPPWHMLHAAISQLHYTRTGARLPDGDVKMYQLLTSALQKIAANAHYSSTDKAGREQWRAHKKDQGLRMIVDPRGAGGSQLPKLVWVGQSKPPASVWTP